VGGNDPRLKRPGDASPPAATRRRRWRTGPYWLALQVVLSGSLLLLFVLPILALFTYGPFDQIFLQLRDAQVREALWFTFYASGISVLVAIVFGIPLGYVLARRKFPGRSVLESLVALPVVVPHLLVGLGLFILFIPGSLPYRWSEALGFPIYYSVGGVVLVMVFVSAPYTVLASQLSFRAVDGRVIEASRSLGAGPATAFLTVTFPLALRGIITGLLLSWARAVSEIGGLLIIASFVYPGGLYDGPTTTTISIFIYDLFNNGNLQGAAAVSSLFLLMAFAIFLSVRVLERSGWLPWRRGDLSP
jgi:molybdate/tungstate transport system permease protein